ncbi:MAG: signal recognition particle receptor subunit alpha, partial [Treponema sp.]|nr:signal recognition particle receptor subunit alpha [Treponema sp.]
MKFGEKIKKFFSGKPAINEELFDALCDLLIEGDFGASQAYKTVELLKERHKKDCSFFLPQQLVLLLEDELEKAITAKAPFVSEKLTVILLLGVNGVGKTTTAAKLSHFYNANYNKKTIL